MKGRNGWGKLAFGWSVWLLIGGCWGGYSSSDEELDALWAQTHAMAADLRSTSESDCGVVAIGSKLCGGPAGYIIYSRATVDEEALLAKVERYTELQEYINSSFEGGSDCLYVEVPPGAISVNGMCVADWTTRSVVREMDVVQVVSTSETDLQATRLTPDGLVFKVNGGAEFFATTIRNETDDRLNALLAGWDALADISADPSCCNGLQHRVTYRGRTLSWVAGQANVPETLVQIGALLDFLVQFPD